MRDTRPISWLARAPALALMAAALAGPAAAQQPGAQLAPWRHGVLEAKSDAGFVFMPSKGGFALWYGSLTPLHFAVGNVLGVLGERGCR